MKYLYHHRTQGLNVEGVHIRSICNALVKQGHKVRLVSVTSTDDDFSKAPVTNNKKNPNQKPSLLKALAKKLPEPIFELLELAYNVYAFFRLWRVIIQDKPDRIYERYSLFLFSTLLLGKLYSIPVVYEINDSSQLIRLRPLFFKRFASFIERKVFSAASGLVFVSQKLQEIILSAYPEIKSKSIISPNASNKDVFYYDKVKSQHFKQKFNFRDQVVCGFIGCFAPWHGVDKLMRIIAPKLKQHPKLTLLLIGDGATLPDVKAICDEYQLDEQVMITGNVPHGEIINYVRSMDFSVLPSSNEYGSPMKMFELMGAGVPLVAADYPPVTEIMQDGVDGWVFPREDINACVDKLFDIYSRTEVIDLAAKAAEKKVHQYHQWANNVSDLETLFRSSSDNNSQQTVREP